MGITVVLACSIVLQFAAAVMAFRLVRLTGKWMAWSLISAALALMALRRLIPFYRLLIGDTSLPPDLFSELIGLALSFLMAMGIMGIAPLFSAAKRSREALRESETKFRTIADFTHDWEYWVAPDGGLLYVSPSCERITGYRPNEFVADPSLIGMIIHPEDRPPVINHFNSSEANEHHSLDFRIVTRAGEVRWIAHLCRAVFDSGGRYLGRRASNRDITARKRTEESLQESEAILKAIFTSVDSGIMLIDPATHTIADINPAAARMFGKRKEDIVGAVCHTFICPAQVGKCPITDLKQRVDNSERVLIRADKDTCPIIKTVTPVQFGERTYLLESFTDVTNLKETEKKLRESEQKFRSVFEDSRDALYITTREGRFVDFNRACLELFGYSGEEMVTLNARETYVDEADREVFKKAIEENGSVRDYEVNLRKKDGRRMECLITATATYADDGSITGYQGIIRDVTEKKEMEERLRTLSLVDELTGLYNRRGFFLLSQQQMKAAERIKRDMLLFYADLDNMKRINDTLGHHEGDKALVDIAAILKETFRESDIIGRVGGDEFAILAIDTSGETRELLVKRLYDAIEACNRLEAREYSLSLSIGIAHYGGENGSSLDELITRADTLMYEEKRKKQQ